MTAFPKASISPWWSISQSLLSLFCGYSHLRKPFQSRAAFPFGLPHFNPAKLGPSSRAGSEEGKILSCLTFCKKLRQIFEVNHHEWSHLRVRPAMPLCGWITRRSELLAEETAGDSFCFVTLYDLPYGPSALHRNVLLCKKKQIITRERRSAIPAACYLKSVVKWNAGQAALCALCWAMADQPHILQNQQWSPYTSPMLHNLAGKAKGPIVAHDPSWLHIAGLCLFKRALARPHCWLHLSWLPKVEKLALIHWTKESLCNPFNLKVSMATRGSKDVQNRSGQEASFASLCSPSSVCSWMCKAALNAVLSDGTETQDLYTNFALITGPPAPCVFICSTGCWARVMCHEACW